MKKSFSVRTESAGIVRLINEIPLITIYELDYSVQTVSLYILFYIYLYVLNSNHKFINNKQNKTKQNKTNIIS